MLFWREAIIYVDVIIALWWDNIAHIEKVWMKVFTRLTCGRHDKVFVRLQQRHG